MGFLDSLFGAKKPEAVEVGFSDLDAWFKSRLDSINRGKLEKTRPVLKSINEIIGGLRKDVEGLASEELSAGVDERFAKIVRTNKPVYVKGMGRVIDSLESSIEDVGDVAEFNGIFKENLELIGKINFGDGRYLGVVYQDIMRRIHSKCKLLLDEQEKLSELVKADDEEEGLREVEAEYRRFVEARREYERMKKDLADSKSKLRDEEDRLVRDKRELAGILEKTRNPEAERIRGELEAALSEKTGIENRIHSSVSKLKRGLRKFGRYSTAESDLVRRLLDNPVECFLNSDMDELSRMLAGFKTAVEEGKIKLKNRDKVLSRIGVAGRELSEKSRDDYARVSGKASDLKKRLDGFVFFREERRMREVVMSREKTMEEVRRDVEKNGGRLENAGKSVEGLRIRFIEKLGEYGVNVVE
jgi:hypothetical protein